MRPSHQQERSRQTASRLLQAAEEILEERGLEKASVPDIAKRAGVSPASIYRRFKDKDGLLREVFERFFDCTIRANATTLQPEQWKGRTLEESVRTLVLGMVAAYSQRPGLLRAVITYGDTHPTSALRRRALDLRQRSLDGIERIILLHEKEIQHPEPPKAVRFALQLIALALRERILPKKVHDAGASFTSEELAQEFSHMLLGYLRQGPPSRTRSSARARAMR